MKALSKIVYKLGLVPTITILSYTLFFEDKNGTEIAMKPLENKVTSYRIKTKVSTTNTVLIDFSFTEEIWTY